MFVQPMHFKTEASARLAIMDFARPRLGFDPAASSVPFVATLVDVTGLVSYFTVAFFILRGTLLR
jgi:magnesium transporter